MYKYKYRMKFKNKINAILSEDAKTFADSFDLPRISGWITKQYNNGHQSHKDFEIIVNWVKNVNPNISEFDFNSALKKSKQYAISIRQDGFNSYSELKSKNVVQKFGNGKQWVLIGPEDCNAICHRLNYDCSHELQPVIDGEQNCYALQDPQDNTICIFIDGSNQIIGQFGKNNVGNYSEVKSLCVKIGINLIPEAYSDYELPQALATKEISIEDIKDISSVMRRLSATDVINCDLLKYSHYCTIKTIYDLYNKTKKDCLILYALSSMVVNDQTKTKAYDTIKAAALANPSVAAIISNNPTKDSRFYDKQVDAAISDIITL